MKKNDEFDLAYKIILVGDVSVGKTSYMSRFTKNVFPKNTSYTIGVDYTPKHVVLQNGQVVKAQIWDTSGHERYRAITTAHYHKAAGALLFFDMTDESTFQHVAEWLDAIRDNTDEGIAIMLIGNKYDLILDDESKRKITGDEIKEFIKEYDMEYMETSAKTGHNVRESFER